MARPYTAILSSISVSSDGLQAPFNDLATNNKSVNALVRGNTPFSYVNEKHTTVSARVARYSIVNDQCMQGVCIYIPRPTVYSISQSYQVVNRQNTQHLI